MGSLDGLFDTKLNEAVRAGDIDGVKVALEQGYDPNLIGVYQWSSIHEAAFNGDREILTLLLQGKGMISMLPNHTDIILACKEDGTCVWRGGSIMEEWRK